MSTQPPLTEQPAASQEPVSDGKQLIAPAWHTMLIVVLIVANSLLGATRAASKADGDSRFLLYGGTLVVEVVLLLLIWLGIRKRMGLRELIGGKWKSVEDFLLDIAVAAAFWVASSLIIAGLRLAFGLIHLHNINQQTGEIKRAVGPLIPQSGAELAFFIVLAVAAGFIEEVIFRGYLQRQIGLLMRNVWMGIFASAAVFGLAHGYQGWRNMIVIGVYGSLFGILVYIRKSLRPGMMVHAFQDGFSGIALFFLTRHGLI